MITDWVIKCRGFESLSRTLLPKRDFRLCFLHSNRLHWYDHWYEQSQQSQSGLLSESPQTWLIAVVSLDLHLSGQLFELLEGHEHTDIPRAQPHERRGEAVDWTSGSDYCRGRLSKWWLTLYRRPRSHLVGPGSEHSWTHSCTAR